MRWILNMQHIEEKDFALISKIIRNISRSKRQQQCSVMQHALPDVVGVKLTNRCNLRCKHCYEWNEQGYHHNMDKTLQNTDIDIEILKKVINETKDTQPIFYLWGGEPLVYRNIDELLNLLADNNRYTIICTNSIMLPRYYNTLYKFDSKIELLIALDGDERSNDALRGNGNFLKTMKVISDLIHMKSCGTFNGKISVHTMISNENIDTLYKFVKTLDNTGIDNLILCFPWYISLDTSKEMDIYFNENFAPLKKNIDRIPSWYAYKYRIKKENIELVKQITQEIRRMDTKMNIQFQPDISNKELEMFLNGEAIYNCDNRDCFTIFSRMDILPNGKVTSCKHFQELTYGDLKEDSVESVWNSNTANYIREIIKEKQMPVCSKCNNLYRHSYKVIQNQG